MRPLNQNKELYNGRGSKSTQSIFGVFEIHAVKFTRTLENLFGFNKGSSQSTRIEGENQVTIH